MMVSLGLSKKNMFGGGGGFPGNQKTPLDTPLTTEMRMVRWAMGVSLLEHWKLRSLGGTDCKWPSGEG